MSFTVPAPLWNTLTTVVGVAGLAALAWLVHDREKFARWLARHALAYADGVAARVRALRPPSAPDKANEELESMLRGTK